MCSPRACCCCAGRFYRERHRTAEWTGTPVPEAYLPLEGPLPARVRTAVTDPGTGRDLVWAAAQLLYGMALWYVSLVLWLPALIVDGVGTGLAGRLAGGPATDRPASPIWGPSGPAPCSRPPRRPPGTPRSPPVSSS